MNEHPWDDSHADEQHTFCAACGEPLTDLTPHGTCPRCDAMVAPGESLVTDFENAASVLTGMRIVLWSTIFQYAISFVLGLAGGNRCCCELPRRSAERASREEIPGDRVRRELLPLGGHLLRVVQGDIATERYRPR